MSSVLADEQVLTSLQRLAVLPGWLTGMMEPGRLAASLRKAVPEIADGTLTLDGVLPDRLRAKEGDWLALCRVTVTDAGGVTREVVLAGSLLPAAAQPLELPRNVVGFGEPGWQVYLSDLGLHLGVQEADQALPALPALVDPEQAARLLERCVRESGRDGTRASATVLGVTPHVVRYKPGSRCTIVYDVQYAGDGDLPDPLVVKTHQGDKGRVAFEAMSALWGTHLSSSDAVTLAEPLAYLPADRILVQGPVPGNVTLKEVARDAFVSGNPQQLVDLRQALAGTAAALAALHGSGTRYGRTATWRGELAEVREVLARLALTVPEVRGAAEPLLTALMTVDNAVPADPLVSAHHDFRPAQVLVDGSRVAFIDFDGSCSAEPALDLGRFRGKLRDIGISALAASGKPLAGASLADRLALLDDLCDGFLAAYETAADVSRDRVLLWEVIDLLTAVLHTWTKVRILRVQPRLTVLLHLLKTARAPAFDIPAA